MIKLLFKDYTVKSGYKDLPIMNLKVELERNIPNDFFQLNQKDQKDRTAVLATFNFIGETARQARNIGHFRYNSFDYENFIQIGETIYNYEALLENIDRISAIIEKENLKNSIEALP